MLTLNDYTYKNDWGNYKHMMNGVEFTPDSPENVIYISKTGQFYSIVWIEHTESSCIDGIGSLKSSVPGVYDEFGIWQSLMLLKKCGVT